MAWLLLLLAIGAEVIGTLALRQLAAQASVSMIAVATFGYLASFALMVPALRTINVGVSYAVWSALGTASVAICGAVLFGDRLNWQAITGIAVILAGVGLLTLSGTTTHP